MRYKPVGIPHSWLWLGLGKLGDAMTQALGYVFGPLFWYAFAAKP